MVIRLPIDQKSLYFNIKNDNETGHTATVATPLRQGKSFREELKGVFSIPEVPEGNNREELISHIMEGSRSQARINNVFVFDNIRVNGLEINTDKQFCFYIREETDPKNIHFQRLKIHYPQKLIFENDQYDINNREILKAVSRAVKDYAFVVEAFEYDNETKSLNFDAAIIGENGIPYSKVFINKKGVGNKFSGLFSDEPDRYDTEIIALREILGYDKVFPSNYAEVFEKNNTLARDVVVKFLLGEGAENPRILKNEYPYSLFDVEFWMQGRKKYGIIQQTATKKQVFTLQTEKIQFINDFSEDALLFFVSDIYGKKNIAEYSANDINTMKKSIASIRFEEGK